MHFSTAGGEGPALCGLLEAVEERASSIVGSKPGNY